MKREKTKYPGVAYRIKKNTLGVEEKVFYIRYRIGGGNGEEIEESIGKSTTGMTAAKANVIRAARLSGKELSKREQRRIAEEERKEAERRLTLGQLWEIYVKHMEGRPILRMDKPLKPYLESLFDRPVESLTTKDADELLQKLSKTPSKKNQGKMLSPQTIKHILGLLKRMVRFAARQDLCNCPKNLTITMPTVDNQKAECMTVEQFAAYWKALDEEEDQDTAAILRIALLTGIRKTALLSLQWDDLDFTRGMIRLRGETAKKKKTDYVPLNEAVKAILDKLTRTESPYVFPPPKTGGKRQGIQRMARRVRDKAGLPKDFRPLHGLRHTFASFLASSGQVDLYTLQKLLTHESPQMTQRYAHLADERLKKASNITESMIPINKDS